MKLIGYIHYYIGCPCIFYTADDDPAGYHTTIDYDTIKNWLANQEETDLKPLLRRLEDMTEDEAAYLALIYSGAKKVSPMKGIASNWHYFFCYFSEDQEGEVLVIDATGCAWYAHYFDKSQPGHRNIVDEHKAFHYLLQNHFDLFGLIDAGLAIDAKTIDK